MTRQTRKPKLGDLVIVTDSTTEKQFVGTVIELLDTQFLYSVDEDPWTTHTKFAFYADQWADYDPTPD